MLKKLSALISSLLMLGSSSCSSSDATNDKKSLIERLKALGNKEEVPTIIDNAMCYEPAAPAPEIAPCSVCGDTTELDPYYNERIDNSMATIGRFGYEGTTECICPSCVKKLIDDKKIDTDLEEGEEFSVNTQYAIQKLRKIGGETYHKVVITHIDHQVFFTDYLRKRKKGGTEAFTAKEIAIFELYTGEKHNTQETGK